MNAIRILALCLLLQAAAAAQGLSRFPHGMYIYENHGVYLNGRTPTHETNARGDNLLKFWERALGINFFDMVVSVSRGTEENEVSPEKYFDDYLWSTSSYLGKTARRGFGLGGDMRSGNVTLFFIPNALAVITGGQYLSFTPGASSNKLVFSKGPFIVDQSEWTVSLPSGAKKLSSAAPLISNIDVAGTAEADGKNYNRHIIRPMLNMNEKAHRADFTLRFVLANSSSNTTGLAVKISNQDPTTDALNATVLDTTVRVPQGDGPFTIELPFSLRYRNEDGSTVWSGYAFGLHLGVDCMMDPGSSFRIKSVAVYDDKGRRSIEDPGSIPNYKNLDALLARLAQAPSGTGTSKHPITFDITDESVIANFAPMHAAAGYIRKRYPGRFRIYATNPESQTAGMDERFLRETEVDYYGKDDYPVKPQFDYWRDIIGKDGSSSYISRMQSVAGHIAVYRPATIPVSVVQVHGWSGQLAEPTGAQIRSMAFISILVNYKGILYWHCGPEAKRENQTLYKSTELADTHGSRKPTMELYRYLFDSTNMVEDKKKAIQEVSALLNGRYTDGSGKKGYIGDLLYAMKLGSPTVLGADGEQSLMLRSMGDKAAAEIVKAEFAEGTGDAQARPGKDFIGMSWASLQGRTYFFMPNLNEDGRSSAVRLTFNSTAKKKRLKLTVLNAPGAAAQTIARDGSAVITIPAEGAVLLEVTNAD